jgi:hypothetical protein
LDVSQLGSAPSSNDAIHRLTPLSVHTSLRSENLFDNIHSDPRWLPFLRKIGKAPEQLAQIKFKVTLPQ